MATTTSYGSITIVDITDIGEFSVYPTANLPLSVIYNPNQSGTTNYTPNWSTTNLTLIPYVYYAGRQLPLTTTTGLTITWKRQEGTGGSTETLNTGETVVNGELHVTANQFTPSSSMITYIVVATYQEPSSGQTLSAQGQITFSLIKQPSNIKECSITGETVFKYNTDQQLVGASNIILTANVNNVDISNWQYKYYDAQNNEQWGTYPFNTGDSATKATLTVKASDNVFFNDVATIKLVTNDNNVYDIHSITKLRDGARGDGTVAGVLTNEDQMIPFTAQGVGDFSDAVSQVIIYEGGQDVTASWTITQTHNNVTAIASTTTKANDTVTVSGMSGNTGNVVFTCRKTGYTDIIKTFSLIKVTSGADGRNPTIYSLSASALAMNRVYGGTTLTPSTVTFSAYSKTGDSARENYNGRFEIFENDSSNASYTSNNNESSYEYTPSASATKIVCNLYAGGGTSTLYDTQTVVVTTDGGPGQPGQPGQPGTPAINVILGNYADVIPCTHDNKVIATSQNVLPISISFSGYKGTSKVACSLTTTAANAKLFGVTPTITQATASADGLISWSIPASTSVSAASGTLSLAFSCEGQTITHTYRWTRSSAALDGTSPIILQIYAPNGDIFNNGSGSLPIRVQVFEGAVDKTSSATFQWAKYSSGNYTNLTETANYSTGTKTSTCTIYAACVDGYASFRCTATYNNNPYVAYISLRDKSDPIQVSVFSSLGSQIVNSNGYGALYVKVTRNGVEIDDIATEVFATSAPSNPTLNQRYYHITPRSGNTGGTIQLRRYNGSSWVNDNSYTPDHPANVSYNWSYRDGEGTIITPVGLAISGKVIYIDGSLVDGKIVADVQVSVN